MTEMSVSDIAAVTRNNNCCDGFGMGGGSFLSWILIFALLGGGGLGWGGNRYDNRCSTVEDLASGFNFSGINNKLNELTAGQANINQNLSNAICQLGYQNLDQSKTLAAQIADCCCTTQRGIDGIKFDMANYAAAINANTTANTQKILDKMCENEKTAMAARIQSLELQQALCGVIRYPTASTYAVNCNPFCNTGCCNGAY